MLNDYITAPPSALVTASTRRIGKAIALSLAQEGFSVVLHYRTPGDHVEETLAAIRQTGQKACALQADLSQEEEVQKLLHSIPEDFAPLTCLINNAAHFENDRLPTLTRNSWDAHMETNLRAPITLMQHFAAQLPEQMEGNIINILDYCVVNPPPTFFSYTISKSALWTATQILALQLAPRIRVNAIGPGPTLATPRQSAEKFRESTEATPLRKGSSPEELCRTIQFILATGSLTGQMILLDGGRHLSNDPYK